MLSAVRFPFFLYDFGFRTQPQLRSAVYIAMIWTIPYRRPALRMLAFSTLLLPVACERAAPVTDASLTAAVQSRLSSDTAVATEPIQATVQNAVVTLNGNVSSEAARALASNDAAQVSGVRTVINNLTVQSAMAPVAPPALPAPPPPAVSAPRPLSKVVPNAAATRLSRRDRQRLERANRQASEAPATVASRPTAPAEPFAPPAPVPVAPPAPVVRNVTLPAGTILPVRLSQTLDSASTQQGQSFSGTLATDVTSDGVTVLAQGSNVSGQVTTVQEAAHFKGNSLLTISLTNITRHGEHIAVSTDSYSAQGKGRGTNTAEKVGGGAAVGAILGGIFGGGKGAAIGAAAGGGTGAGVNGLTRGQQVQIPSESLVRFRLANPLTVRVVADGNGEPPAPPDGNRRPLPSGQN